MEEKEDLDSSLVVPSRPAKHSKKGHEPLMFVFAHLFELCATLSAVFLSDSTLVCVTFALEGDALMF